MGHCVTAKGCKNCEQLVHCAVVYAVFLYTDSSGMWQTFAWRWPDGRFQTASVFDDIEEGSLHTSGAVAVVQCSRSVCYTSLLFNLASFQWLTNGFNGLPTYPSELAHTHAQDSCAQRLQATAIFFIVISKIIVLYFFCSVYRFFISLSDERMSQSGNASSWEVQT